MKNISEQIAERDAEEQRMRDRKPVAYVEAVVRFPLYEGDDPSDEGGYDWFVYEQPGIKDGELAVCRRPVKKISHKVVPVPC